MDTNTGESPGHQSQSKYLGNSPSEEEMGHWTPTGAESMVRWMDGWMDGGGAVAVFVMAAYTNQFISFQQVALRSYYALRMQLRLIYLVEAASEIRF